MEKRGSEDKRKSLADKTYGDFQVSPIPIAPDGGIAPGYAPIEPSAPPVVSECEKGPCRHFWLITAGAGEGNPEDTWVHLGIERPVAHVQTCTAHPGTETELSRDEPIYSCNRWDPIEPIELIKLEKRRQVYRDRAAAEEPTEDPDQAVHTTEESE